MRAPNQCSVVLLFNIVQVNQGPGGAAAWFLLARDAFLPLAQEVVRAQRLDRDARFVFEVKQLELALRLLFQPMFKSHLCVCVRARACSCFFSCGHDKERERLLAYSHTEAYAHTHTYTFTHTQTITNGTCRHTCK